jgi:intein/homing endonuclease
MQNNFDKTYYLLGTLEDYMGRRLSKDNPAQQNYIMTLHQSNSGVIKRIEEITTLEFQKREKRENCVNCHEFYELLSYNFAREINFFYVFNKQNGRKDKMGYTLYTGELICSKILNANKEKQYSFLAGLFLIQGYKIDEVYKISLANSPWKYECTIEVLKVTWDNLTICKRKVQIYMPALCAT